MFKRLINKLFKRTAKEPEPVYTMSDLECYRNTTVTESDVDEIIRIRKHFDDADYMFGTCFPNDIKLHTLAIKQAILDYAYHNYTNTLKNDKFGEHSADIAYYNACEDNNEDSSTIAAGYYALSIFGRYYHGWSLAQELNLKCETKIRVDFTL